MTDDRRALPPTSHRGGRDPLDEEIRRLLAVEPSPAFEAGVRSRVAGQPTPYAWPTGRLWMALGAAAAVVLSVAGDRPVLPTDTRVGPADTVAGTGDAAGPRDDRSTTRDRSAATTREDGSTRDLSAETTAEPAATPGPAIANPPVARPPGPPRFTRVVFSESEREALRQLLAQARNRPVVAPVPAEGRAPVAAGEVPSQLPPVNVQPPAALELPLITIEPLTLALLDTGAVE